MVETGVGSVVRARPIGRMGTVVLPGLPAAVHRMAGVRTVGGGLVGIAVEPGRARVVSDPSPRQYCVKQGWLMRPGEIAICAPNRVSVQITGRTKVYDSISY